MSTTKHTAGPFGIDDIVYGYGISDTRFFRRIYSTDPGPDRDFTIGFIRDADPNVLTANGALLSAAPELLAALEELVSAPDDNARWLAIQHARAAIARARGVSA